MDPTYPNRFLGLLPPSFTLSTSANAYELNEDDVLWTNHDPSDQIPPASADTRRQINHLDRRSSLPANSGILAALPDPVHHQLLYRRPSPRPAGPFSSKSIPRPPGDPDIGGGIRKTINQSAPVKVPVLSAALAKERRRRYMESEDEVGVDEDGDEEMLPPHEIVARGSRRSPRTTFSMLEGVGRTLKGRDLRQVRNAVWRQTGFLD